MFSNIGVPGIVLIILLIICIPLTSFYFVSRFLIKNEKRAREFQTKVLDRMERLEKQLKK